MSENRRFNQGMANQIRENLKADCTSCYGLCCTALHITASSDFAMNKAAGTPCSHLQSDYRCQIHSSLREKGYKGCTVFDCLGAGQTVSQVTFNGQDWRKYPQISEQMFRVFPIMEQLHEMIAYIAEALTYEVSDPLVDRLSSQLEQLLRLSRLDADALLSLDLTSYRVPVNELLLEASESIRNDFIQNHFGVQSRRKYNYRGIDWIGKKLIGKDLRGADLRRACLIAADMKQMDLSRVDFIGADLRDADLSGANLSTSMFLTQMQMNSAKGDRKTKLPSYLQKPSHWVD